MHQAAYFPSFRYMYVFTIIELNLLIKLGERNEVGLHGDVKRDVKTNVLTKRSSYCGH